MSAEYRHITVLLNEAVDTLVGEGDGFYIDGTDRPIVLARELTKTFETFITGTVQEVLEKVESDPNQRKGEFVLIVQGAAKKDDTQLDERASDVLDILLKELSVKQASSLAAKITGVKKKVLYQAALDRQ